jgi:hypothetical protein
MSYLESQEWINNSIKKGLQRWVPSLLAFTMEDSTPLLSRGCGNEASSCNQRPDLGYTMILDSLTSTTEQISFGSFLNYLFCSKTPSVLLVSAQIRKRETKFL